MVSPADSADGHAASAATVVYVGMEGAGVIGSLAFRDSLRPDAVAVVSALQAKGVKVLLVSGDSQGATAAAAREAGIPEMAAIGGMRPEGKVDIVRQLRSEGRTVAVVGDGVNDAPALAASDVGIAMSGGMDAAAQAASIVLMGNRLGQAVEALELGKATLAKIRQNLAWALMYNLVGIPLAAGVLLPLYDISLSPAAAGGMMAFSSVAVVTNSLLLRSAASRGSTEQQQTSASQTALQRQPSLSGSE